MGMQSRQHEQTGLPDTSCTEETPLPMLSESVGDIERRLELLRRHPVTGLLDTTAVNFSQNLLSMEDRQAEIQKKLKISPKKGTPRPTLENWEFSSFSQKKTMDIIVVGPIGR